VAVQLVQHPLLGLRLEVQAGAHLVEVGPDLRSHAPASLQPPEGLKINPMAVLKFCHMASFLRRLSRPLAVM
jgi:hypothetical protein